jgi:hypothetical protein
VLAEAAQRPRARERQRRTSVLERNLVERVVGDVLALPVVAVAAQVERRREPREVRARLQLAALERVLVDDKGQFGYQFVRGDWVTVIGMANEPDAGTR